MTALTLAKAKRIISATFAKGKEMGLKPLSVIVLDEGGNTKAFERQDGAPAGRYKIAEGKAYTAVMMGVPTSKLTERATKEPHFATSFSGVYGGKFVTVAGGLVVRDKRGQIVGAVGVTGDTSDNDAIAGAAGIEAAGLIPEA